MPPPVRDAWLESLGPDELAFLVHDWRFWARDDQLPPPDAGRWTTWLILGGRGAGKTRAGAEWVRAEVEGASPLGKGRARRIALVGETYADVREVMVDGPSGLLAIAPRDHRPQYEASRRRLVWPNGAVAQCFSAEDPDALRGPQFDSAWSDEFCKWRRAEDVWSNLQLGLRLGDRPRQTVTTTPRPTALLKKLMAAPTTVVTRAATYANTAFLADTFLTEIVGQYEGTRIGRQELQGEILTDTPGALWRLGDIDRGRVDRAPELERIVVGVDPPVTSHAKSDACGVIVAGVARGRDSGPRAYVLEDATVQGVSPRAWAERVVAVYRKYDADRIVVEVNQGGDLVSAVLAQVDQSAAVRPVRARRGKIVRAEPVAALYERGRVAHAGAFPALEDEMTRFTGDAGEGSPDRLDALVWALTDLMLSHGGAAPAVRRL